MNRFSAISTISPYLLLIAFLLCCQNSHVVNVTDKNDLDQIIESEYKRWQMPGVAYAAIRGDSVFLSDGKGYADCSTKRPLTPATRFMIASIAKTMAATALMQLYEKNLAALDGDISNYLPFTVRNPRYPNIPVTVEMLLTHTSSISSEGLNSVSQFIFGYVDYWQDMMAFHEQYLVKGG